MRLLGNGEAQKVVDLASGYYYSSNLPEPLHPHLSAGVTTAGPSLGTAGSELDQHAQGLWGAPSWFPRSRAGSQQLALAHKPQPVAAADAVWK